MAERRTPLAPDRRLALSVLLSALIMCVIGVYYAGDTGPGALDARVRSAIDCRLGNHTGLLRDLVLPTSPYLLVPAIAVIVVVCLILGRRRDAALAAVGPAVALAANTWVLKPLFDRQNDGYLVYPSGHTVSLVSTLAVLVLLARPGVARWIAVAVGAVLLIAAGTGMIGLGYHYFTDVVGGTFFAVAVVCAMRFATSRLSPRPSPAPSSG